MLIINEPLNHCLECRFKLILEFTMHHEVGNVSLIQHLLSHSSIPPIATSTDLYLQVYYDIIPNDYSDPSCPYPL